MYPGPAPEDAEKMAAGSVEVLDLPRVSPRATSNPLKKSANGGRARRPAPRARTRAKEEEERKQEEWEEEDEGKAREEGDGNQKTPKGPQRIAPKEWGEPPRDLCVCYEECVRLIS